MSGADFGEFGRPLKRLRAPLVEDPYNPARTVPDWDGEVDELVFNGFIATASSVMTPDGAREQAVTAVTLTVADHTVDIRRGARLEDGSHGSTVGGIPGACEHPSDRALRYRCIPQRFSHRGP